MAQSNSLSSLEALIQAAQYLEENGRECLVRDACVDPVTLGTKGVALVTVVVVLS